MLELESVCDRRPLKEKGWKAFVLPEVRKLYWEPILFPSNKTEFSPKRVNNPIIEEE